MPDHGSSCQSAIQALHDCIEPVLLALRTNSVLTPEEQHLIHDAVARLNAALKYWESRQTARS